MDNLAVAIPVFLGSAIMVVFAGMALAKYGDDIAEVTGWGTLWVGTILVSIATSLPELITNISALVIVDPPSPGLALGNVFGADMINIFTVSIVAIIFGARNLFADQAQDTKVLILVAVGLGIVAAVFGAAGDWSVVGITSAGGLAIAVFYVIGMKRVYEAGRLEIIDEGVGPLPPAEISGSARTAWLGFGGGVLIVLIAAPLLATSADGIAEASGLGRSFIGVLLVSIVTTLSTLR